MDEKRKEVIVRGSTLPNSRKSHKNNQDLYFENTEPRITHNVKQVPVEVVIERPVIKEIIVEKPYDVFIEKPVENIIEKEVIVEKIVEIPIKRIIHRERSEIVNTEKEEVVMQNVVTERYVENPIEKVTEKQVIIEKPQTIERIEEVKKEVHRTIARPHREEIQIKEVKEMYDLPIETVVRQVSVQVDKYVDVEEVQYVDKIVEKEVEKLIYVDKYIDIPKEQVVLVEDVVEEEVREVRQKTVDVYKDVFHDVVKKVSRPKPIKKSTFKDVEVIQEKFVEVEVPQYRDTVVEKEVIKNVPREVVVEKEKQVDLVEEIEVPQTVTKEIINEVEVETPIYRKVVKYVEVPVDKYVDKVVERPIDIYVEKEVKTIKKIDKVVPKVREVYVEKPIEKKVEKVIEVEVIKDVPVYVDKIVEKKVEKIIEKRVEVSVPRFVEKPVERVVEKIVETEVIVENPVYVERDDPAETEIRKSAQNERLRKSYSENQGKIRELREQKQILNNKLHNAQVVRRSTNTRRKMVQNVIGKEDNQALREELDRLHNELTDIIEQKQREAIQSEAQSQVRRSARSRVMTKNEAEETRETFVKGTPRNTTLVESTTRTTPRVYTQSEQMPKIYNKSPVHVNSRMTTSPSTNMYRVSGNSPVTTNYRVSGNYPGTTNYRVSSNSPVTTNYRVSGTQYVNGTPVTHTRVSNNVTSSNLRNSANITYGVPRKSETRYYRFDKDGNKVYVDEQEQSRLDEQSTQVNGTQAS